MTGWIRLHRGWRKCEAFEDDAEPLTQRDAWVWLIEFAAWKDCFRRTAKGERIKVSRGQFHTSLRNLGSAWKWGKWKVQRYLERLEDNDMIRTAYGQSGVMITICNYAKYQDVPDNQDDNNRTATGQLPDTQEQRKQDSPSNEGGVPPTDTVKTIFEIGVSLLEASGNSAKAARSIVGRWRKDHTDARVLEALLDCQARRISNPVEWMPKRLTSAGSQGGASELIEQGKRYAGMRHRAA